ncbi:MAG: hypothetical protein GY835_11800 [bacterium]|nr:hypothetical protein [bacterium]
MFTRFPNAAVLLVIGLALSTASPGAGDFPPYGPVLDPIGFGPALDPIGFGPALDPHGYGPVLDPHGYGPTVDPHGLPAGNR